MTRLRLCLLLAALALPLAAKSSPPSPCPEMPALSYLQAPPAGDFLSPQQEGWLGQMVLEMIPQGDEFTSPALVEPLHRVLNRLSAQIPKNQYSFRVHLLDADEQNAWIVPGGNIYITRPLIELMRNDDELAAVLAHEMGHEITRQIGFEFSRRLRQAFGLRAVGDRADLRREFNRYYTWAESHPVENGLARGDEDANQDAADRIALLLMARAGFDPRAFPTFMDRAMDLRGNSGGTVANWLGLAAPNQHRLHEAVAEAAAVERECAPGGVVGPRQEASFAAWREALTAAAATATPHLPGLLRQTKLRPPLEADFRALAFSPDGRNLLAEDAGGIWVLSANPLAEVFRIRAPEAMDPQFSPDSERVLFHTPDLRLEVWDVARRARVLARQFSLPAPRCYSSLPSPAADRFACIRGNGEFDLFDSASGAILFHFGGALSPEVQDYLEWRGTSPAAGHPGLAFSPSGRFLLVTAGTRSWVVDAENGGYVALGEALRNLLGRAPMGRRGLGAISFASDAALLAPANNKFTAWEEVAFPSGAILRRVTLAHPEPYVRAEIAGRDWIAAPAGSRAIGVMDPATGQFILNDTLPALAGYGDEFAAQAAGGRVVLLRAAGGAPTELAELALPAASLPDRLVGEVSEDLGRLALSGPKRGGLWNLDTGTRVIALRGFNGAWVEGTRSWFEFPPIPGDPARVIELDLAAGQVTPGAPQNPDDVVEQFGPYLATVAGKGNQIVFSDARGGGHSFTQPLWGAAQIPPGTSVAGDTNGATLVWVEVANRFRFAMNRHLMGFDWDSAMPPLDVAFTVSHGVALLAWPANAPGLYDMVRYASEFRRAHGGDRAAWVQEVNLATGQPGPGFMINPAPDLNLRRSAVAGEEVLLADGRNRILAFNPATGAELGTLFGKLAATCPRWLAVRKDDHTLALVDASTLTERERIVVPSAMRLVNFGEGGGKLMILTDDQTAYFFATPAAGGR